MSNPNAEEQAQKDLQAKLQRKYSLTLTQQEWIILHNAIAQGKFSVAEGSILLPILLKIRPFAAVDTNIQPVKEKKVSVS